ncbi:hypothetical protein M0805_009451 [Coniferiporia weirii]|nr:hypothetical protein M0805_009451 [Coniferiporia weirii]
MPSYVVTGALRGLGLGFIRQLAAEPSNTVFALVRDVPGATELHELVASNAYRNIYVLHADLHDYKSINEAAAEVSKITGGTLDVLINNGALLHHERNVLPLDKFPDEETLENDMLTFFKTNVIGVTHTLNAFLPLVCAGKTKKVAIITSEMGSPHYAIKTQTVSAPAYSISKAGVNMVFAKYTSAYKDQGITFLAISPGLMKTMPGPKEFVDGRYDRIVELTRATIPDFSVIPIDESVRDQIALIEKTTLADTGSFVHYDGKKVRFPSFLNRDVQKCLFFVLQWI